MKINSVGTQNKVYEVYGSKKKSVSINAKEGNCNDTISISDLGKTLNIYSNDRNIVDRNIKIEEIKNQIKSGEYKVDSNKLAKGMVEFMKGDKI